MKLTATTFTTLDGVMQAPGGPTEDTSGNFRFGGWLVPFADADMGAYLSEVYERASAFLLGRTTYDMMQRYWSQVTDHTNVVGHALNELPKYVATHRPSSLSWYNARALENDTVAAVRELKRLPGRELQIHGSHALLQTMLAAGLVDELNVWTYPVLVGWGKRLFGSANAVSTLRLTSHRVTSRGVVVARYEVKGAVDATQSFAVADGLPTIRQGVTLRP